MRLTKNYLEKLGPHQLSDLAEFVVAENFNHHGVVVAPEEFRRLVKSIYSEEVNYYPNSEIYITKDHIGFIESSIRVLKWNYVDLLPIQKIFGINPISVITNAHEIFHIGRFSIRKNLRDIKLLKQLIVYAIAPVCQHEGNVVFAECDRKLYRTLTLLGIETEVLGKSMSYLGSETIPLLIKYDGLIKFFIKNENLMSNEALIEPKASLIHQSVVSNYYQHYYSFV